MTDTATDEDDGHNSTTRWSRRGLLAASASTAFGLATTGIAAGATAKPPTSVSKENFHIYLLFGQSNMEGQGTIEPQDRATRPDVRVLQDKTCPSLDRTYGNWYVAEPPLNRCWAGIGPGDYFGKTMAAETPDDVVVGLVPTAVSGCEIALFEPDAPIGRNNRDIPEQFDGGYEWMLDLAKQAQNVGTITGILLHQGESDAGDPQWKYSVQNIYQSLREDLGLGPVPLLAGEMLYANQGGACAFHNEEVNKLPNLIDNAHVVSAKGLAGQDQYHFTTEAYREFGRRYATVMLDQIDVDPTPTTTQTDTPTTTETPTATETPPRRPTWPTGATDPNGDGRFEDLSGNGQVDFPDVNRLFQNSDTPNVRNNAQFYDFETGGGITLQDVMALFQQV
ncbi:MAG: sialate O-acetylesterase [Halococcoides sp.]